MTSVPYPRPILLALPPPTSDPKNTGRSVPQRRRLATSEPFSLLPEERRSVATSANRQSKRLLHCRRPATRGHLRQCCQTCKPEYAPKTKGLTTCPIVEKQIFTKNRRTHRPNPPSSAPARPATVYRLRPYGLSIISLVNSRRASLKLVNPIPPAQAQQNERASRTPTSETRDFMFANE